VLHFITADWLSDHATLIVGVVGIIVSGILGPTVTTVLSRDGARREFKRNLVGARRDDLRQLLDEAALAFGAGITNLRLMREAKEHGQVAAPELDAWAKSIFPLGQRLRLRLPSNHRVVTAYEHVRDRLTEAQEAIDASGAVDTALDAYEGARAAFLETAREAVQAPIDENEEL
jgi:hypothetical protein